jgi:hypothetical protein
MNGTPDRQFKWNDSCLNRNHHNSRMITDYILFSARPSMGQVLSSSAGRQPKMTLKLIWNSVGCLWSQEGLSVLLLMNEFEGLLCHGHCIIALTTKTQPHTHRDEILFAFRTNKCTSCPLLALQTSQTLTLVFS